MFICGLYKAASQDGLSRKNVQWIPRGGCYIKLSFSFSFFFQVMKNHQGLKSVCFGSFIGEFYPDLRQMEKAYPLCKPASRWLHTPSGQMLTHRKAFFFGQDQVARSEAAAGGRLGGGSSGTAVSCLLPGRPQPPASSPRRQTIACASWEADTFSLGRPVSFSLPQKKRSFLLLFKNVPVSNSQYFFFFRMSNFCYVCSLCGLFAHLTSQTNI